MKNKLISLLLFLILSVNSFNFVIFFRKQFYVILLHKVLNQDIINVYIFILENKTKIQRKNIVYCSVGSNSAFFSISSSSVNSNIYHQAL